MPDIKFTFDPAKVKITDGEILADLSYPARPEAPRARRRQVARPAARRR